MPLEAKRRSSNSKKSNVRWHVAHCKCGAFPNNNKKFLGGINWNAIWILLCDNNLQGKTVHSIIICICIFFFYIVESETWSFDSFRACAKTGGHPFWIRNGISKMGRCGVCVFVHGKYRVSRTYPLISGTFCLYPPIYRILSRLYVKCRFYLLCTFRLRNVCVCVYFGLTFHISRNLPLARDCVHCSTKLGISSRNQNTRSESAFGLLWLRRLLVPKNVWIWPPRDRQQPIAQCNDMLISHDWHQTKSIAADVNEKVSRSIHGAMCVRVCVEDIKQEKSSRQGEMP